ncbi:MAG: site-specific DNA-methyltransferase [Actinobacteria bacterium]|nr:site-specific DNA-methyltransferase [Actinomycetota bacterium]
MASRKKPTSTSNFGVSRRENHDATEFYARFTSPELSDDALIDPRKDIDEIFFGSAVSMAEVPDRSVALVVTSPPYFAGKEYEEALGEGHVPSTYLDYLGMLEEVFAECVRKLEPGGRIAVNVANLGRKPYRSLSADVTTILQDKLRLLLRGEVLWQKGKGATGSCAWGSFQRPANPVLRDLTERVVIASKGRFDRAIPAAQRHAQGLPSTSSLSRDEFMEATTDLWEIPPESATRVGHPAPFPVELPERLIHLYTYYDDLVLDPFMGSGTTAIAALRTRRHYAGYETDPEYCERARARLEAEIERLAKLRSTGDEPLAFVLPAVPLPDDDDEDLQAQAVREGKAAKDVARALLDGCGFRDIEPDVRFAQGVEVNFRAYDQTGQPWFFDVSGGFTSSRAGLRRTDTLWKSIGKAAVLQEIERKVPLVLLTTDAPVRNSAGDRALRVMSGKGQPIFAVVQMQQPEDQRRLRAFGERGFRCASRSTD